MHSKKSLVNYINTLGQQRLIKLEECPALSAASLSAQLSLYFCHAAAHFISVNVTNNSNDRCPNI